MTTTLPRYGVDELKRLLEWVLTWEVKEREVRMIASETTGEVRAHYDAVIADIRWKITKKVGMLWYYMTGDDSQNPFSPPKEVSPPASTEQS
jgi:hypothetical protein